MMQEEARMSVPVFLIVCGVAFGASLAFSIRSFRNERYGMGILIALLLPAFLVLAASIVHVLYNVVVWLMSPK